MPELKFNTKIYKKEAIKEAISAYSHLAKFTINNTKNYIRVKIDNANSEFKNILRNEFSNYVLGMTKKCF